MLIGQGCSVLSKKFTNIYIYTNASVILLVNVLTSLFVFYESEGQSKSESTVSLLLFT